MTAQIPIIHVPVDFGGDTTWGDLRAIVEAGNDYMDYDRIEITETPNGELDCIVIRAAAANWEG